MQSVDTHQDRSAALIELPYASTTYKLFELIEPLEYVFSTTSAMRDIARANSAKRLLRLAPDVIVGTFRDHPNVAGILSTLLSGNVDLWKPSQKELSKLEGLCSGAIEADDWTTVACVEPLAFAIAAKGKPAIHKKVLARLVAGTKWNDADTARSKQYYGGVGAQVAAIIRHFNDPFRRGSLLRANDVGRLMDVMLSHDKILTNPKGKEDLVNLLGNHAKVLSDCGEVTLAKSVIEFIEGLKRRFEPSGRDVRKAPKKKGEDVNQLAYRIVKQSTK